MFLKVITSENVVTEAQFKDPLISWISYVLFLKYKIFVLNHSITWKVETSWVLVLKAEYIFNLVMKLGWPTNRYNHGQFIFEILFMIWRTGS